MDDKSDKEKDDDKWSDTVKSDSVKEYVVDKEALQAFRYFDHNRVGYIKVDDLRCLLHNLGKFLSHRDVKIRFLHDLSLPKEKENTPVPITLTETRTSLHCGWS